MEIHARPTPNPNALKFVIDGVRFAQPQNFASADAAAEHPLAARLFALEGVYNVFLAQDFVTVNKRPETPWQPLTEQVQALLAAAFVDDGAGEVAQIGADHGRC